MRALEAMPTRPPPPFGVPTGRRRPQAAPRPPPPPPSCSRRRRLAQRQRLRHDVREERRLGGSASCTSFRLGTPGVPRASEKASDLLSSPIGWLPSSSGSALRKSSKTNRMRSSQSLSPGDWTAPGQSEARSPSGGDCASSFALTEAMWAAALLSAAEGAPSEAFTPPLRGSRRSVACAASRPASEAFEVLPSADSEVVGDAD